MRSLKIAGLCLASLLVMGTTLAGNASAAKALWLLCLEGSNSATTKYQDSSCSKALAGGKWESVAIGTKSDTVVLQGITIALRDTKGVGGTLTIRCDHPKPPSEGLVEGNLLIIHTFMIETISTECERIEGACKTGEIESFEGLDLPWKLEVTETEGSKFLGNLKEDGNGTPGWTLECNSIVGKIRETCSQVSAEPELLSGVNVVSSGVLLVFAEFLDVRSAGCIAGFVALLLAKLDSSGRHLGLSLSR